MGAADAVGGVPGGSLTNASKGRCPDGGAAARRPLDLRSTGRDNRDSQLDTATEVTPKEIIVRFSTAGSNNSDGLNIYDRSWNLLENRPWRFSPHDGSGIQAPLAVGKTWPVKTNNINSANGAVWKRSGTSKVVGQESITTRAGTFDTFKIETTFTGVNVNNPTSKNEVTSVTWYAPAIDHWVKRTFVSRANKHLQTSNTLELVDYGRKS
jgi:hypothetical protein